MFQAALPEKMRKSVNDQLINYVNSVLSNPDEYVAYRDNLISYTSVMQDGKYKIENYLDAVRYVTFKLMGHTDKDAYMKTFPKKWQDWIASGVAPKDMASYVTAYHKGKLVNAIMAQTMIPVHVLNLDLYQRALNEQFILGTTAKSEMVRSNALNSVLTQLRPPDKQQIELNVSNAPSSELKDLGRAMMELAAQQKLIISSGLQDAQSIAHSRIIEAETVEVKDVG